jgi:hypothetical protein
MMKRLFVVLIGICFVSIVTLVAFAKSNQTKEEYCTEQRKQCAQKYTVTNSQGIKVVTPEGTKLCWEQYRECMGKN